MSAAAIWSRLPKPPGVLASVTCVQDRCAALCCRSETTLLLSPPGRAWTVSGCSGPLTSKGCTASRSAASTSCRPLQHLHLHWHLIVDVDGAKRRRALLAQRKETKLCRPVQHPGIFDLSRKHHVAARWAGPSRPLSFLWHRSGFVAPQRSAQPMPLPPLPSG